MTTALLIVGAALVVVGLLTLLAYRLGYGAGWADATLRADDIYYGRGNETEIR